MDVIKTNTMVMDTQITITVIKTVIRIPMDVTGKMVTKFAINKKC